MAKNTCCICDPELPINPNVCARHKLEGLRLARTEGIQYREAADRLYWQARDSRKMKSAIRCYVCEKEATHFSECGGGALICDDCVRAGLCCGSRHPDVPGISVTASF